MINFGSIYLVAKDFDKSLEFYKLLFEKDVAAKNMERFAIFDVDGFCLAIMNGYFDVQNPDKVITKGKYCGDYDDYMKIVRADNTGKIVINLNTDDLKKEYHRSQNLG